jgi:hypothetical protein
MRRTCVHSGDNLTFSPRWTEMDDDDNCTAVFVRPRVHCMHTIRSGGGHFTVYSGHFQRTPQDSILGC